MQENRKNQIGLSVVAALGLCLAQAANADDGFTTTISGFGTLGGTYTGNSGYTYIQVPSQSKATNSQFDLGLDSRIGVQATITYGTNLSVTVQEEAKRRGSDNFSLGTEWAFFQYAPTADLKLRLGRVALATFLTSDSRDVGYAQPWFHAPNDFYTAEPFQTLDGGQVLWHANLGPVGLDVEGAYGSTSLKIVSSAIVLDVTAKSAYNLAAALTYGDMLFRVAETEVSTPYTLPLGPATTVNYQNNDKFFSVGFQYDNGTAIFLAEWAKRTENDIPIVNLPLDISTQWYVAGGWRFGKLTPLVSYSKSRQDQSLLFVPSDFSTPMVSLRYDIATNVALKTQVVRAQADNPGYWVVRNPGSSERVTVFSLGADFVF